MSAPLAPVRAAVLVVGSRLLSDCSTSTASTTTADNLPTRLRWGGVRVVIVGQRGQGQPVDLDGGVTMISGDGDWSVRASRATAAAATPINETAIFVHDDDDDACAPPPSTCTLRVVRVPTAATVETAIARSHARCGGGGGDALLVGVCMRPSRERDLLARGLLPRVPPTAGACRCAVFEFVAPPDLTTRVACWPPLDVVLHKVTDELASDGSACGGRDAWPATARALADCASWPHRTMVIDDVTCVMRLGDRWATLDALKGATVPTPPAVRVAAGTAAATATVALAKAGVRFPVVIKPRDGCGTHTAHALAIVLRGDGLAPALASVGGGSVSGVGPARGDGVTGAAPLSGVGPARGDGVTGAAPLSGVDHARGRGAQGDAPTPSCGAITDTGGSRHSQGAACDVVIQPYVDHGGVLHKVYVAGNTVHVTRQPSLPDLGTTAGIVGGATNTAAQRGDPAWVAFDSTATARTATALAATSAAAAAEAAARVDPIRDPSSHEMEALADCARRGTGLTLFGMDVVVDRASGRLLVVDTNYFPSMAGVPPHALGDAVCAVVCGDVKK